MNRSLWAVTRVGGGGAYHCSLMDVFADVFVCYAVYLGNQRWSWSLGPTRRSGGTGTYWPVVVPVTLTFRYICRHIVIIREEQFDLFSYYFFFSLFSFLSFLFFFFVNRAEQEDLWVFFIMSFINEKSFHCMVLINGIFDFCKTDFLL